MNIKEVFEQHPEGFSIKFEGYKLNHYPKKGYMVSITNYKTEKVEDLENLFKSVRIILNGLNCDDEHKYIGGWCKNGSYYLDASLWVEDEHQAFLIAQYFNQEAVFDCELEMSEEV